MKKVYRLIGARQASFGIETDREGWYETLRESFGEYELSAEVARMKAEVVAEVSDFATYEERWDLLAGLEGVGVTWAQQDKRIRTLDWLDSYDEWSTKRVQLSEAEGDSGVWGPNAEEWAASDDKGCELADSAADLIRELERRLK